MGSAHVHFNATDRAALWEKPTVTIMQHAKGKIEIFTHIYKLGLLPCSLAAAAKIC